MAELPDVVTLFGNASDLADRSQLTAPTVDDLRVDDHAANDDDIIRTTDCSAIVLMFVMLLLPLLAWRDDIDGIDVFAFVAGV